MAITHKDWQLLCRVWLTKYCQQQKSPLDVGFLMNYAINLAGTNYSIKPFFMA